MAKGAWAKSMIVACAALRAMQSGDDPLDLDPYGLFREQEPKDDGRLPYNPAVLQAIQDSGKFR
jgi:hypothetical protein